MTAPDETLARAGAANLATGLPLGPEQLTALHNALDAYLAGQFATSTPDLRLEARDEAIVRFMEAGRSDTIASETALAYLRAIARNIMIDQLRRARVAARRLPGAAYEPEGDDAVARFVETDATAVAVEALLRDLAREGDHVATRVINAFLVIAQLEGHSPPARRVAVEAGVSHSAVLRVLARARKSLAESVPDDESRS